MTFNEQQLSKVHPELARRVRLVIAQLAADGIALLVHDGLRTFAEQDALYAQGRTVKGRIVTHAKGGQSNHNYGLAVDLVPVLNGRPSWDWPADVWKKLGRAAEAQGLEWGGRWKMVDMPHVQLHGLSVADCRALYRQGGLSLVWQKAASVRAVVEQHQVSPMNNGAMTPAKAAEVREGMPTPPPSVITPTQSATREPIAENWLVRLRKVLPVTSLVSSGASSFLLQYRWPLLAIAACAFCFWLGWHLRSPREK
jgi:hypothetical protein